MDIPRIDCDPELGLITVETAYKDKYNTRVIVVGSSSSLEGKGLGEYIDSFDIVIRCNWFDPRFSKDYGTKFDVLYSNTRSDCLAYVDMVDNNRVPVTVKPKEIWLAHPSQYSINYVKKRWGVSKIYAAYVPEQWNASQRCITLASRLFNNVSAGAILDGETCRHYYDSKLHVNNDNEVYQHSDGFASKCLQEGLLKELLEWKRD